MVICLSVRNFVEFLLRNGDIDNRKGTMSEDAMAEGARIHRQIQNRMGIEYHAEVPLEVNLEFPHYSILIEGRADGIIDASATSNVTIDEIKSTYRELKYITEPEPVHLAQAKCYAYIYANQNKLEEISVRMTYCNIETEQIQYFYENYSFGEIEKWFMSMVEMYRKWADFEYEWREKRTNSIRNLVFPFDYREGQKQLVSYVYQTIIEHKKLFMEAPTGVGKTISNLYPAIKAMGEGKAEKIFYLTAKTITGTVAKDTLNILREQGLHFKSVTITAKEKMCPLEECTCNPDECPYAKGHFDRINDAVYDLLTKEDAFDREIIADYALSHEVCPFEMCLDMSLFSDGIIGDYNYLFDPRASLKRFFADGLKGSYLFLIDEAHNLVDRGREMYSATLVKEDFLQFKANVSDVAPYIGRLAEKCNKELLAMKRRCTDYEVLTTYGAFVNLCNKLYVEINKYLDDHDDSPIKMVLLDFYFQIGRFLDTYDRMTPDHYVVYTSYDEEGRFFIKEFCVDPSEDLKLCMDKGVASVLFSATFLPIQYYKQLLGGVQSDYEVYAESTFDPNKRLLLLGNEVTSKYTRRSETEYENIAKYIYNLTNSKVGNYMVFFPSHAFLESVKNAYMRVYGEQENVLIVSQRARMTEDERDEFLNLFSNTSDVDFSKVLLPILEESDDNNAIEGVKAAPRTLIGFCVLGGIFSEGIDLKNDSLIGAIIVGTGLPQVCAEREILKDHFDQTMDDGFDFAYKIPGMNKVLQAAGRVIRTKEDTGIVALLDERFLQNGYKRMFPHEWKRYTVASISNIYVHAVNFWEETDNL